MPAMTSVRSLGVRVIDCLRPPSEDDTRLIISALGGCVVARLVTTLPETVMNPDTANVPVLVGAALTGFVYRRVQQQSLVTDTDSCPELGPETSEAAQLVQTTQDQHPVETVVPESELA